ncbi:hypothetical protein BHE74_00009744 [Ensete ventricosum]|nr:hypothetical protein GW17_00014650 [Ensete ventricosum]RWW81832.1 hypothetical protein BHE74_00009744 [Ensete ventricosum]RZR76517.1 hypothetical protein BHM03_00001331 [Ensete ventricosum]
MFPKPWRESLGIFLGFWRCFLFAATTGSQGRRRYEVRADAALLDVNSAEEVAAAQEDVALYRGKEKLVRDIEV